MRYSYSILIGKVFTVSLLISALAGCEQVEQQQQKIAFIDMEKVLQKSDISKQESDRQQKVHNILTQAQKEAEARYGAMADEQRNKSQAADSILLNGQWIAEQRHAREASLKAIAAAVEAYRVNHKMTLVLNQNQFIAIDKRADISTEIIEQLKGVKVNYGELPEVAFKTAKNKNIKSTEDTEK